jgi:hypothetical protein
MMACEVVCAIDGESNSARMFVNGDARTTTGVTKGVWVENMTYIKSLVGGFTGVGYSVIRR